MQQKNQNLKDCDLTAEQMEMLEKGNILVKAVREKRDLEDEIKGMRNEAKILEGRLGEYQRRINEAQMAYDETVDVLKGSKK